MESYKLPVKNDLFWDCDIKILVFNDRYNRTLVMNLFIFYYFWDNVHMSVSNSHFSMNMK